MPILPLSGAASSKGALVPISRVKVLTSSSYFTNIPQIYRDLRVIVNGASGQTNGMDTLAMWFNEDYVNTNWSQTNMIGNGSSNSSTRVSNAAFLSNLGPVPSAITPPNTTGTYIIDVFNYSSTDRWKTFIVRSANDLNGWGTVQMTTGLWRSTAGINRLNVYPFNGLNGTQLWSSATVSLYGVRAANQ